MLGGHLRVTSTSLTMVESCGTCMCACGSLPRPCRCEQLGVLLRGSLLAGTFTVLPANWAALGLQGLQRLGLADPSVVGKVADSVRGKATQMRTELVRSVTWCGRDEAA